MARVEHVEKANFGMQCLLDCIFGVSLATRWSSSLPLGAAVVGNPEVLGFLGHRKPRVLFARVSGGNLEIERAALVELRDVDYPPSAFEEPVEPVPWLENIELVRPTFACHLEQVNILSRTHLDKPGFSTVCIRARFLVMLYCSSAST